MKVIDIYDNGGYRSEADDMLALRLRMMASQIPVAALRRRGPAADSLASDTGIDLLTCGFGMGSKLSMPYKVKRLAGDVSPVILHTHSLAVAEQAGLIARAYPDHTPKIVIELHSGSVEAAGRADRFAIDIADALVFHTQADRDIFMASHPESETKTVAVIAPGYTVPSTSSTGSAPEEMTLLWSGRISPSCGISDAVEAIGALYPDKKIRMIVAGQGEARGVVPVLKRVKALGLSDMIEFVGDAALTPALMERASALLVTSGSASSAGWQTAMAAAYGLPMIMADSLRNRELAGAGHAVFYDRESDMASRRSLTDILSDIAGSSPVKRTHHASEREMQPAVSALLDLYSYLAASR